MDQKQPTRYSLWETLAQHFQGDAAFEACKRSANTEVDPVPKGQVAIGQPVKAKSVWIGELRFIAIG